MYWVGTHATQVMNQQIYFNSIKNKVIANFLKQQECNMNNKTF